MGEVQDGPLEEVASTGGHLHLVLTVPAEAVELAADRLWQCGATAVEERRPIGGAVELWTVLGDEPEVMVGEELRVEVGWHWRTVRVDTAPAETWRAHVEPVDVAGRLVVVPAWRDAPPQRADRLVLQIEPGGAFGLGDHPTTWLSLDALLDVLDAFDPAAAMRRAASVLDVGCGTGVLAIAAARLGATPVRAIDIAPSAIEATSDNARRNGVAGSIHADRSSCGDLAGSFDVVVANLLAPTLISIAGHLERLTAPDGRLVVSGVLSDRYDHVVTALEPMAVERITHRDGWAAITLRHRSA